MSNTPVKKVAAFPIEAVLTHNAKASAVRVVKMNTIGLMVEVADFLTVGAKYTIQFDLPVLRLPVGAQMVCVRTWDQYAAGEGSHKLAELHFQEFSGSSRDNVLKFLKKIGALK